MSDLPLPTTYHAYLTERLECVYGGKESIMDYTTSDGEVDFQFSYQASGLVVANLLDGMTWELHITIPVNEAFCSTVRGFLVQQNYAPAVREHRLRLLALLIVAPVAEV